MDKSLREPLWGIRCLKTVDKPLLTDAKAGENLSQEFVAAEATSNGTQAILGAAEIFGDEFGGAVKRQLLMTAVQVLEAVFQGAQASLSSTEIRFAGGT